MHQNKAIILKKVIICDILQIVNRANKSLLDYNFNQFLRNSKINIKMQEKQSDFLFQLFEKLSTKLNKPLGQMKQFYSILKDNWYDTEPAIRELTDQQYSQMKIPGRLVTAIKQQLGLKTAVNQQTSNQQTISNNKNLTKSNPTESALNEYTMIQYANQLQNDLKNQYKNNIDQTGEIFNTLYKIIHNIVQDPYQIKFRTLKKSNNTIQRVVVANKSVSKFLALFGFQQDSEKYYLHNPRTHELIFIQEVIQQKAGRLQPQKTHNPFLGDIKMPQKPIENERMREGSPIQNFGTLENQFSQQKVSEMKYVDALQKLIEFRHQVMSKPPANRNLKIYHKKHQTKDISDIPEIDMQNLLLQKTQDKMVQSYWGQLINQNIKNASFQSKRKQQFDFLIKQKIYQEAIIKVKLPNELIIEARFGPEQKLKEVMKLVSNIIIGDLYLFHTPPVKKYDKEMDKTLNQLDSAPMGSFYLGINGDWYIQNQYSKIIQK